PLRRRAPEQGHLSRRRRGDPGRPGHDERDGWLGRLLTPRGDASDRSAGLLRDPPTAHGPPDDGGPGGRRPAAPVAPRGDVDADGQAPVKTCLRMTACTPQLPSTTCVTPKSTATDISEMASSSLRPRVVIRKWRILRNASRIARSTEDFS